MDKLFFLNLTKSICFHRICAIAENFKIETAKHYLFISFHHIIHISISYPGHTVSISSHITKCVQYKALRRLHEQKENENKEIKHRIAMKQTYVNDRTKNTIQYYV